MIIQIGDLHRQGYEVLPATPDSVDELGAGTGYDYLIGAVQSRGPQDFIVIGGLTCDHRAELDGHRFGAAAVRHALVGCRATLEERWEAERARVRVYARRELAVAVRPLGELPRIIAPTPD